MGINQKELIGIELVSYTNKDGRQVTGTRLYISSPLVSPNQGCSVVAEFVNGVLPDQFRLGPVLAVLYEPTFNNSHRCVGVLFPEDKVK